MSEYNGSPLRIDQWEEAESKCKDDEILSLVWKEFKTLHKGQRKESIIAIDQYLSFIRKAIDMVCGVNADSIGDDELEVGENSSPEAIMNVKVKMYLSDKDDKTADRLSNLVKLLFTLLDDRERIFSGLGGDDQDEVTQLSRHAIMALRNEQKIKEHVSRSGD